MKNKKRKNREMWLALGIATLLFAVIANKPILKENQFLSPLSLFTPANIEMPNPFTPQKPSFSTVSLKSGHLATVNSAATSFELFEQF